MALPKHFLFSVLLNIGLFIYLPLYSQERDIRYEWVHDGVVRKATLVLGLDKSIVVGDSFAFNALAVRSENGVEGLVVKTEGQSIILTDDYHGPQDELGKYSNLVHFTGPTLQVIIENERQTSTGPIEVYMIKVPEMTSSSTFRYGEEEAPQVNCEEPASIAQSSWRAGLPSPSYTRVFTDVSHVIVHHSAGNNDATDYNEVVRAIYLFHTDVRGWSDIGYNYLIAPDGTVFKGRDPLEGEQDNIKGAHFCGKNSGTMGVCLLGTFTSAAPSQKAISSLVGLVSWKLNKEDLDPFGKTSHAANANLGHIAGHRDGCATECPGQTTYNMMGEIRTAVDTAMAPCRPEPDPLPEELIIYPNPSAGGPVFINIGIQTFQTLDIIDRQGRLVCHYTLDEKEKLLELHLQDIAGGLYFFRLTGKNETAIHRVFIRS